MERLRISPESVGEPIGSGGNGLWLLDEVRAKIHRVAFDYSVLCQSKGCTYGLQDNSDTQGKEEEGEQNAEGLAESRKF